MSHRFMVVVSGTSEYSESFVHVFDVLAETKEEARRVAIDTMNDPFGVLREYRKIPADSVFRYNIEFIVQSD